MKKSFVKIIYIFILIILLNSLIFSNLITFASNNIDFDLSNQLNNTNTSENLINDNNLSNVKASVSIVDSSENTIFTTSNILNILLIVIGFVLILLAIAILIRLKK